VFFPSKTRLPCPIEMNGKRKTKNNKEFFINCILWDLAFGFRVKSSI
jgi:hypothetical protein